MKDLILGKLLNTSLSLSSEKDGDLLLEDILTSAMEICNCDAGTIYVKNDNHLDFKIMITKSLNNYQGGNYSDISMPPVELVESNICAKSLVNNEIINIPNLTENTSFDFAGPKRYDAITGYKTISMLVVPLVDSHDERIGVLQLMNALNEDGEIVPFNKSLEIYVSALASQAAVSVINLKHKDDIRLTLESLVEALSTAIHIRTSYNVTHTKNMVAFSEKFIDWLNESDYEWEFDSQKRREFLMSVLLHDVGKLTISLEVMNKETRLGREFEKVMSRFELIKCLTLLEEARGGKPSAETIQKLEEATELVTTLNTISYVDGYSSSLVEELRNMEYIDLDGNKQTWITELEKECLQVVRGTLTIAERDEMQTHVKRTSEILANVKFGSEYSNVARWAGAHHEFLDGKGYPNGLKGDQIDKEIRLLTIIDVFEGLSASNRPYKPAMPIFNVLNILSDMVDDGKLDGEILNMFIESRAWE